MLGVVLGMGRGETSLTSKLFWVLHDALTWLLARPQVDGFTLRIIS